MPFHSVCCCDGNFEQRRCSSAGGSTQHIPRPRTVFVPHEKVQKMRAMVESVRKDKTKKGEDTEDENSIMKGLHLPNYIYEECTSRFTAAKESSRKAESSVFSDTGLMALTCRHDHVLFVVNLQDAGEKQYNALALLDCLYQELPASWRMGVLYDIGCQMHKSIIKVHGRSHPVSVRLVNLFFCSTTFSRIILTEWRSASPVFMLLPMILPVSAAIILRSAKASVILMEKVVSVIGRTFRS